MKFPYFFPTSLQAKTAGISKLVDDEACSILSTKNIISLTNPLFLLTFMKIDVLNEKIDGFRETYGTDANLATNLDKDMCG